MLRFRFGTGLLCALAFSCVPLQVQAQSAPIAAQQLNTTSLVNVAGRQRMLAQRMTKAYLMLGQGIDPDGARTILQESIQLFETQLAALKALPPDAAQAKSLAQVDAMWARCKPLLTAHPTRLGADVLYDLSEELQQVAHHVTLGYRDAGNLPLDQFRIGIWGRVRPLETPLRERDRIEVYRPLTVDPMEARRLRYAKRGERIVSRHRPKAGGG